MNRARFCTVAAVALALFASTASAQSAKDAAEAKRHFDVAEKLYAQSQFEPALSEYETSYKLGGKRSALMNAADCQRKLNRFADAYESYERVIAEHGDKLKPKERQAIVQAMNELAQLTGTIEITSNEAGATVSLDGHDLGVTPLAKPKRASIAKHHVRVSKQGFDPFEQDVEVASQSAIAVNAALKPESLKSALVVHEQNGKPVHVFLDGNDVGPAPWKGDVDPGDHTLELKGDKIAAEKRPITIQAKNGYDFVLAAEPIVGHVRVTTTPSSASISIDDKPVGNGVWDADVDPGLHRIDVALGATKAHREVTVKRGDSLAIEVPLVLPPAGPPPPMYRGLYGGFTLGYAFWLTPPRYNPETSATTGVSGVEHDPAETISLTMRLGYAIDFWAVEFVGTLMVMHSQDRVDTTSTFTMGGDYTMQTVGMAGFFGVGGRISTKTEPVRVSFGLAPGVFVHGIKFNDQYSDNNQCPNGTTNMMGMCVQPQQFNPGTTYVAPALHADLGFMFGGSTPGAKFLLGAEMWMAFPSKVDIGPDDATPLPDSAFTEANRSYVLAKTPEVFIAPTLGVQWGH